MSLKTSSTNFSASLFLQVDYFGLKGSNLFPERQEFIALITLSRLLSSRYMCHSVQHTWYNGFLLFTWEFVICNITFLIVMLKWERVDCLYRSPHSVANLTQVPNLLVCFSLILFLSGFETFSHRGLPLLQFILLAWFLAPLPHPIVWHTLLTICNKILCFQKQWRILWYFKD